MKGGRRDLELPAPRPDQARTHLPARVHRSDDRKCVSARIAGDFD